MKQKRNWGKEIKDLGTLILIVGAISISTIIFTLFSDSPSSYNENKPYIYQFVNDNFVFLFIGGLFSLLIGIIVRSVGKSKEAKYNADNDKK
jgi:hypothetical protein